MVARREIQRNKQVGIRAPPVPRHYNLTRRTKTSLRLPKVRLWLYVYLLPTNSTTIYSPWRRERAHLALYFFFFLSSVCLYFTRFLLFFSFQPRFWTILLFLLITRSLPWFFFPSLLLFSFTGFYIYLYKLERLIAEVAASLFAYLLLLFELELYSIIKYNFFFVFLINNCFIVTSIWFKKKWTLCVCVSMTLRAIEAKCLSF